MEKETKSQNEKKKWKQINICACFFLFFKVDFMYSTIDGLIQTKWIFYDSFFFFGQLYFMTLST